MKRFLTSPLAVLIFAGAAALAPIGYRLLTPEAPGPGDSPEDVLGVLASPTLAPSHDVAFWTRLRSADPERFECGLAYCAKHPDRPNCQALRTSSWLNALHQDADRAREGYLASGSDTASPTPEP
jgi:hypothetical protein